MKPVAVALGLLLFLTGCASQQVGAPRQPVQTPPATAAVPPAPPAPAQPPPPAPALPPLLTGVPGLLSVHFIDAQIGWVGARGSIFATTDGGQSWVRQVSMSISITHLDFVDRTHGWALGGDVFLQTADGGRSWVAAGDAEVGVPQSIAFVSPSQGWVVSQGRLFTTGDGGQRWSMVPLAGPTQSVCFADGGTGWAAGEKTVYQTQGSGQHWRSTFTAPVTGDAGWRVEVHCSGRSAWVLFHAGKGASRQPYIVWRTLDAGATWQPVLKQPEFASSYPTASSVTATIDAYASAFTVVNEDVAYFLGQHSPSADGSGVTLTRTVDGGKSFTHVNLPQVQALRPVNLAFISPQVGWVVGITKDETGVLLATRDGGATWQCCPRDPDIRRSSQACCRTTGASRPVSTMAAWDGPVVAGDAHLLLRNGVSYSCRMATAAPGAGGYSQGREWYDNLTIQRSEYPWPMFWAWSTRSA